MEFGLKWVHMARYELILRLERALWLPIILKPLLTPKRAMESSKIRKKIKKSSRAGQAYPRNLSQKWLGCYELKETYLRKDLTRWEQYSNLLDVRTRQSVFK